VTDNEPRATDPAKARRKKLFAWTRLTLFAGVTVAALASGQWAVSVLFGIVVLYEIALMRWGVRVRVFRAGLELGGIALILLIVGVVLLTRRSFFLGALCVIGSICLSLVIVSISAFLRRHGLFQRES
jgi:hypothetical protein